MAADRLQLVLSALLAAVSFSLHFFALRFLLVIILRPYAGGIKLNNDAV